MKAALWILVSAAVCLASCSTISRHPGPARELDHAIERGWAFSESSNDYFASIETNIAPLNFSSPVLEGDRILLATSRLGLVVLQKESGQVLWHKKFAKESFNSKPLVFQGRILVGSDEAWVHSFQFDTGVEQWKVELPTAVRGAPIAAGDRIVVTTADESVHALDPSTGKILWTYKRANFTSTSIYGGANPAFISGKIWVGFSDGAFVALEPNDGSVQIEKSFHDNAKFNDIDAKALSWKDFILVPSYDGKLRELKKDGTVVWEFPAGGAHTPVLSSYLGNTLLFASSDGAVYALNAESGKELWHHNLKHGIPTGIGVFDEGDQPSVIVASSEQYIYALDLKTGKEIGRINLGKGSGSYSSVIVDQQKKSAYVLTQFSRLYQIKVH